MAFLLAGCLLLGACSEGPPAASFDWGAPAASFGSGDSQAQETTTKTWFSVSDRLDPLLTELHLAVKGGSCPGEGDRLDHVDVQETEAAVTVTVFLHVEHPRPRIVRQGSKAVFCDFGRKRIEVPVRLPAPLGMRDLVDGACLQPSDLSDTLSCSPVRLGASDPQIGHWQAVDPGPLATRGEPQAVWTGSEVIVVGGLVIDQYQALSDGAAFDPVTGRWRRIADRPAPGRVRHAAWTGTEMFTFGTEGIELGNLTTAFAYNPATDRWRPVALPPPKATGNIVWTGRRLLAWQPGGAVPGALYDPATNRWSPMPAISVPRAATAGAAVWTGHELAVEGAVTPEHGGPVEQRLFLFDPEQGTWRVSSKPPIELSMWLSLPPDLVDGRVVVTTRPATAAPGAIPGGQWFRDNTLIYDPAGDSWRRVPAPLEPDGRLDPDVNGGLEGHIPVESRGSLRILDAEAGRWSTSGPPPGRPVSGGALVSIGTGMFVFGISTDLNGGRYALPREPNAAYVWAP